MSAVIWHNPKCTTSGRVLEMIRAAGIEPRVVEYVKTPPTVAEIKAVLKDMGLTPRNCCAGAAPPMRNSDSTIRARAMRS
jgi:arsenate reductase (glutaredoxin)